MTDHPPDPLDELASAHLDGATTPEEEARLAADPALQARVEALRPVRDAVSRVDPVDEAERTATVAAVLARLDQGATVTPLAPISRRPGHRAWRIVAAAAAVVAVALLIPFLTRHDSSDSLDAASSETTIGADNAPFAVPPQEESGPADAAGAAPTSTTVAHGLPDLGHFATIAALEAAVDAAAPDATTFQAEDRYLNVPPPCTGANTSTARETDHALGTARIGDEPVVVLVDADGERIVVLDATSCAVIADDAR